MNDIRGSARAGLDRESRPENTKASVALGNGRQERGTGTFVSEIPREESILNWIQKGRGYGTIMRGLPIEQRAKSGWEKGGCPGENVTY